jgi:multidrug resistance efflux pump
LQARTLEEEAARDVQRTAEEHAKAQLELRRLDLLSMRYAVPRAQHDQARNHEDVTRQRLEKARSAREEYSRVRAAVEGELYRIKAALTELKSADRQARVGMPDHMRQAATAPAHMSSTPDTPALVAPADALVADVFVQPGMWAQPHQQLIALLPADGSLEATAWFSEKDGASIRPGQICRVFVLELPGKSFAGNVEQVLPAGSLTPKPPLAAAVQTRQVPVRIRFSAKDAGTHAELKSGMRAAVRVHHFTPPWRHIGAAVERLGGK